MVVEDILFGFALAVDLDLQVTILPANFATKVMDQLSHREVGSTSALSVTMMPPGVTRNEVVSPLASVTETRLQVSSPSPDVGVVEGVSRQNLQVLEDFHS